MEMTQARVHELFDYREDGALIWRVDRRCNHVRGCIAGWRDKNNYQRISIDGRKWAGHQLVYLWHHGVLPPSVDHKDRDPANNRIDNLRAADHFGQTQNQKSRTGSTSRWKGVSWQAAKRKWRAYIQANRRLTYLGSFDSEADAALVYNLAAYDMHGQFAVYNLAN